jgi:carbon monoxide dehydrogenase subunit G
MELKNDFVVDRPVDEAWKILTDLELIAPCLPGAQLQEVEGDEYRGTVSVKVGPITGKYKGKASFVERDEENKVAKLRAEGRDPRQGNANALITAVMVPAGADGDQTRVELTTDLGLSGKIASFARGNLEDVSRKLLDQFAQNLEALLAERGSVAGAAVPADVVAAADTVTGAATTTTVAGDGALGERPTVRKIEAPEAQPIDLLAVGGADHLAKKLAPILGVVVLVLVVRWLLRRRCR